MGYLGSDAYGNESREHSKGLNKLNDANAETILVSERMLLDNQYVLQSDIYYKSYMRLNAQVESYENKAKENETNGNYTTAGELRVVAENLRNEAERMLEIFRALDIKTIVPIHNYTNTSTGYIDIIGWRAEANAKASAIYANSYALRNESDSHFENASKQAEKGNKYLAAGTVLSLSTLMSAVALVAPKKSIKIAFVAALLTTYTVGAIMAFQAYTLYL